MFDALAQTVTQIPDVIITATAPGETQIVGVTAWITAHTTWILAVGVPLIEILFRLWPSDRIRSLLSYSGRILKAIGQLCWVLSDLLSKIIPDRRATPTTPPLQS